MSEVPKALGKKRTILGREKRGKKKGRKKLYC
jgi:hypothetical protein